MINKIGREVKYNIIKAVHDKHSADILLGGEKLRLVLQDQEDRAVTRGERVWGAVKGKGTQIDDDGRSDLAWRAHNEIYG